MDNLTEEKFIEMLSCRDSSYSEEEGGFLFHELFTKSEVVRNAVIFWVKTGCETDLEAENWSTKKLMKLYPMNYIASALTIDWLKREPQAANKALQRKLK